MNEFNNFALCNDIFDYFINLNTKIKSINKKQEKNIELSSEEEHIKKIVLNYLKKITSINNLKDFSTKTNIDSFELETLGNNNLVNWHLI